VEVANYEGRYLAGWVPPSLMLTRTQLVQLGASATVRPRAALGHG